MWMRMFASVYHRMAQFGFPPRQVDELHVWEAAVILGVEGEPAVPMYRPVTLED